MGKIKVPILETDRLILRGWKRRDAAALYSYAQDPEVGPNAGWKPHESVSESRQIITTIFQQNTTWAITLKEDGDDTPVGSIGFEVDPYRPNIYSRELGYSLNPACWGKGIMTEAARRMIRYGFEDLGLASIMIRTSPTNDRSRRVIEKCGFTYEGTLRRCYKMYNGQIRDSRVYSMMREEYEELLAASEE